MKGVHQGKQAQSPRSVVDCCPHNLFCIDIHLTAVLRTCLNKGGQGFKHAARPRLELIFLDIAQPRPFWDGMPRSDQDAVAPFPNLASAMQLMLNSARKYGSNLSASCAGPGPSPSVAS